ncbi:polyadenylate-binding protein-interacting protein 3-like protein isoform X1 [Tanacetum coccineum]|uniref:Polyadenylate-binding protein-interacting protein 3-like protein isoform X1 n=1 Tax=Tanacetum coccineum TaxID=301880 RepID=A0ABQ4ZPN4_9ASTR
MNLQQAVPPRSSANGYNRMISENEMEKSNFNKMTTAGCPTGDKGGDDNPSRERLVFLTSCLIGHPVEVQVIDGSVYSGIFHATNAENDFGVILKMACLTKAGSSQVHKSILDFVNKTPTKTLIIPSRQLVQIVGKSVPVTKDGLTDEFQHEKQQEIMTDTLISRSQHVELERELEPWVPDDDNIECPELDNTFDRHWNRIAREIEGEDTQDLHLAEERGIHVHSNFELDEETKYSSVMRGVDDSGYEENEDIWDSENTETFGNVSGIKGSPSSRDRDDIVIRRFYGMLYVDTVARSFQYVIYAKKESFEKGLSAGATAYAPSSVMSKAQETTSSSEVSEGPTTVKINEATQPATSTSECGNVQSAASAPGLSPSSSMNSLNSEKSTLNLSSIQKPRALFHRRPLMGTSFAPHQPVMYGPQATSYQSQQPYFQSTIPQYGQQMHLGQPRQMMYMPTYPPTAWNGFCSEESGSPDVIRQHL